MIVGDELKEGSFSPIILNGSPLDFVTEYRYLGVNLVAKKCLSFSAKPDLRSFYRASNAILYSATKPNERILMKLLYTNCVSILSYACSVKQFDASEMTSCNTAINNAIRRIFSFKTFESVRHLRQMHNCLSIYEIFARAKSKFLIAATTSSNTVIKHIANCS